MRPEDKAGTQAPDWMSLKVADYKALKEENERLNRIIGDIDV